MIVCALRYIHKTVAACRTGWRLLLVAVFILAFRKLGLLDNNLGSVYLAALAVVVASRLDPASYCNLCALSQVLLSKFGVVPEGNALDKVGSRFASVFSASAVYGESVAGYRHRLIALRVSYFGISGEPPH